MGYSWTVYIKIHKNDGTSEYREYSKSGYANVPQGSGYNAYFDLPGNPFSRDGYNFIGYAASPSGGVTAQPYEGWAEYFGAGTGSRTISFYDVWSLKKYTVSYNVGGGDNAPANQTKTHGVDLTLSNQTPTWTGHTFVEWNTAADGTGTSFSPGGTFAIDANTTLYAIWSLNTYTVSFNANGGSGAPANQTKNYGETLTLSDTVPTRSGYDFVEWNTASDGSGSSYMPGDSYISNAALTLYAIWIKSTFTVTYDANGHGTAPAAQSKQTGDSVTIAAAITYTGLTMTEWNTAADGTGTSYDPGDTYSADADLALYAIWTVAQYTITFDADGGTVSPATKTVLLGDKYGELPVPVKTGETFYGWFLGDLLVTANAVVEITEDSTLKAAWTIRSLMRVKGSDNSLHTGALYVKGSDSQMHMAIAYVKGSDSQMHING